jgi:anti-sigma regulatory factor (Ser/Thr protein kinase)
MILRLTVPISLAGLAEAQEALEAWAAAQQVPRQPALRLRLVVEELVVNLLEHADWPEGPLPARLEVAWTGDRLSGALEDAAQPFDMAKAPEPIVPTLDDDRLGGLGLGLVRHVTEGLRQTRGADGWTRTEFNVRLR